MKSVAGLRFCGLGKREVVLTNYIQAVLTYKYTYTSVSTLNALGVLLTNTLFALKDQCLKASRKQLLTSLSHIHLSRFAIKAVCLKAR